MTFVPHEVVNKKDFVDQVVKGVRGNLHASEMSFAEFLKHAWTILEPANRLIHSWYIDLLSEHLQLVTEEKIKKLLINMPPRNGKSNIVTILWPVWSWTLKPWLRFIFCSYSSSLSTKHSIDRRRIIESPWFQQHFGNRVQLAQDQNQKNEYQNISRGHMISTSVGGTVTGKGGDVLVEDDMINPLEAESDAARHHAISMHQNVLSTRLDNPKTGIRVIVEQRTHHKDISGHVLETEKGWTRLVLPLRADQETRILFPVTKREIIRPVGDLLNPLRQGEHEVEDLKKTMGTRAFVSQCQQTPTAEEGNILKRAWWKFWKERPLGHDIAIQSWDMTFKKTEDGSFVVGQVWWKRGANYYLIDQFRDRVDFADSLTSMIAFSGKHPSTTAKLVEDQANGPAIISALKTKVSGILPIKPSGSKIARAQAIAPLVEAGNVFLPDPAVHPWVHDFIEECAAFRGSDGETNDQVDSMSQALTWLTELNYHVPEMDMEDDSFLQFNEFQSVGGFFT